MTFGNKTYRISEALDFPLFCKSLFVLILVIAALSSGLKAQEPATPLRGKVSDVEGNPVAGATIQVKGGNAVVASADGSFELKNVKAGSTVRITHIGYQLKELTIAAGQKDLRIVLLQSISTLDDVVVNVGLYKRPVATFTGASSTMTGKELRTLNPTNVLQALSVAEPSLRIVENNAMGSDPNTLPVLQLRGQNNLPAGLSEGTTGMSPAVYQGDIMSSYLSNPNQPLLILDGFQTTLQRIYDMDINLIERITVLKDAAATAAYGSRAANGVIVIETKQPTGSQLRVNYSVNFTTTVPDLSSYNMMNAPELLEAQRIRGIYNSTNNYNDIGLKQWYDYRLNNVLSGVNTDWLAQPVRVGFGTNQSLSVMGGNGNAIRYSLGFSYANNVGVMQESNRNNFNINSNISYNNSKLRVSYALNISRNYSNNTPWGNYSSYVQQFPFYPVTDSVGNITRLLEPTAASLGFLSAPPNPVLTNVMYNSTLNVIDYTSYLGLNNNVQIDYTFNKSLRLRGAVGLSVQLPEGEQYYPANHTSFVAGGSSVVNSLGSYSQTRGKNSSTDGRLSLDFNKQINRHTFFVSVGGQAQQTSSNSSITRVTGSPSDNVNGLGMLNGYNQSLKPSSSVNDTRSISMFASATYTYANRYTIEATANASGSSQFGKNNRLAPFWAFGGSWIVDKERFFKKNSIISALRILGNLGVTGNQNFSSTASQSIYQYNLLADNRLQLGSLLMGYANPNLKWQQTKKYSVAIQAGLFQGKLNINFSGFIENTDNLILPLAVAPSTGFESYNDNLGATQNKGYEISIGTTIVRNTAKNIIWSLAVNGGHFTNVIKSLSPAVEAINKSFDQAGTDGKGQTQALPRYVVGESMSRIWAVRSLGIDPANGYEVFQKLDGSKTYIWDPNDKVPIGEGTSFMKGAITSNFTYKNWSLNIALQYQWGGYMYNQTLVDKIENIDISRQNADKRVLTSRWKQPGDITSFKGLSDLSTTNATSRFVQKNDYIDGSSIGVAYTFPRNLRWVKALRLSTPRIAITQNNVFRFGTIAMERGTGYPFARSFSFGLATNF